MTNRVLLTVYHEGAASIITALPMRAACRNNRSCIGDGFVLSTLLYGLAYCRIKGAACNRTYE